MFRFPRDPVLKEQWVKQVQRTRAQWKPSESSVLCSKHFTDDCFEVAYDLATQFGIKKTRKLKPGAVPSLFLRKMINLHQPERGQLLRREKDPG